MSVSIETPILVVGIAFFSYITINVVAMIICGYVYRNNNSENNSEQECPICANHHAIEINNAKIGNSEIIIV